MEIQYIRRIVESDSNKFEHSHCLASKRTKKKKKIFYFSSPISQFYFTVAIGIIMIKIFALCVVALLSPCSLLMTLASAFESPCEEDRVPFPYLNSDVKYICIDRNLAFVESMKYMEVNLPSFDVINKGSLGFKGEPYVYPDGLNEGVANVGANYSLDVRSIYSWAAAVPKDVWLEYVLPYANVNEARNNWRPLLLAASQSILLNTGDNLDDYSIPDVVYAINAGLWAAGVFNTDTPIVFKSSQTPLIYDPMSTLAFGYSSCTGVSIFFIDALRSVGVPARIAGTPAWNGAVENGNHNWLEVWTGAEGGWQFIEAAPAGTGETLDNPCDKWFCNPNNFANGTQVFAARFAQSSEVRYPMAWDLENTAIPGVDRSADYQAACNAC